MVRTPILTQRRIAVTQAEDGQLVPGQASAVHLSTVLIYIVAEIGGHF